MDILSDMLLAAGIVLVLVARTRRSGGEVVPPWTKIAIVVGVSFIVIALVERAPDFVRWFISGWNAYH